ncbi:MAG: phosphate propanoyltransferase [Phycisphaerae bacterium]
MSTATAPFDLNRSVVEQLVRQALQQRLGGEGRLIRPASHNGGPNPLVVNVSARHMHICQADLEVLFGPGAKLTKLKDLYQQGEFASEQVVNIIGPRSRLIPGVRILGPIRDYTQIELSYTDGIFMGLDLPLRISGDHHDTPGTVVVGPHGALNLTKGVIRAMRHVHMNKDDMAHYKVKDGDMMKLHIQGPCGVVFENLKVREHPKVRLEVHIDTDEGNACNLESATRIELLR